ncbi:complement C1q tumor necrosis factor-related protein 1 isoform X2 [Saccopteryx leptura]|uniref:complement C1q tumor necrosis factor-related protein 1 isoform X2 n=1 Tax=Saccopteryx leptura TaxID=249018 RepID=UPI00339BB741
MRLSHSPGLFLYFRETPFPLLARETSEPRRTRCPGTGCCPHWPPLPCAFSPEDFSFFPALSFDKSVLPPTWAGIGSAAGRCSERRCWECPEAAGRTPTGGHGGMMGSRGLGLMLACLLLAFTCGPVLGRLLPGEQEQQELEGTEEPLLGHTERAEEKHENYSPRQGEKPPASRCYRCCAPGASVHPAVPVPQINITILKGEKGDRGHRGMQGKYGKTGSAGARGHMGPKGQKGSIGAPGDRCKNYYAAFSVGRKKPLHSNDYYQTVIFDTEFVNLYSHFNMFTGKFYCYVPGIYFFSLNVHTWNQKETYLHIMKNGEEVVILYAQVSDRSIMQSQSLMLELQDQDEVWVRLFKGERENAIFSDEFDTYITFSGYLVKHATEP